MSKDEAKEMGILKQENAYGAFPMDYDPFKTQVGGRHYAHFAIQPGEFISKNKLEWYEGNIIKYVTRSRFKGQKLEDLKKARHYLDMAIAEEEQRINKLNLDLMKQQTYQAQVNVAGQTLSNTTTYQNVLGPGYGFIPK